MQSYQDAHRQLGWLLTNGFSWPLTLLLTEKLRFETHASNTGLRRTAGRLNSLTGMIKKCKNDNVLFQYWFTKPRMRAKEETRGGE